ncbi:LacI family transcriptional regulator [Nesterenkonia sp. AY15]|uniref:LacI family DNA-binding transcriptional regulator n=1 Tax=Nesterenkonia sp. AY15 TaxID=2901139 RepID=UPI001F4CFE36|nr:LacI family DNA-binding transcriptional regulator [Nesterenkonia sp. AY15]MCH8572224.1 LacI family transcriptional regulator [Nesterenkonia sp. AY15]
MKRKSTDRRPTMADVARGAGVSIKTVSRVINDVPTVDESLAKRVRTVAKDLGFRSNMAASALRSGAPTATIGLLIKDLSNEFYANIASAVAEVAREHGTQLITAHSGENADDEMEAILDLCARRVDGLLIVPTGGNHSRLKSEIELGIPMVFLDRRPTGLDADVVILDNVAGARNGVEQLIEQGNSRIAILLDTLNMPTMRQRLDGARSAFSARGLPLDDSLIKLNIATPQQAEEETERLLESQNPPTAFFCGNNRSAIGTMRALWKRQENQQLLAFDDFFLSEFMPRSLSVVRYDNRALGSIGADLLFRRISGESFPSKTIVLPTEIVRRGISC